MKKLANIFVGVSVAFFIWFICSFINFNMCNNPFSENYQQFAPWNLISIIIEEATENSQNV